MEFTQPAGMKMPKSWPNRSNIPVCGMQTTANLNQCGIGVMARVPKSRREEGSCERGTEREENKSVLPLAGLKRQKAKRIILHGPAQHAAMAKHARCDGKVSAQAFFGQYAAKRKGTRWLVGHKSRRLATSILPHEKRSR